MVPSNQSRLLVFLNTVHFSFLYDSFEGTVAGVKGFKRLPIDILSLSTGSFLTFRSKRKF